MVCAKQGALSCCNARLDSSNALDPLHGHTNSAATASQQELAAGPYRTAQNHFSRQCLLLAGLFWPASYQLFKMWERPMLSQVFRNLRNPSALGSLYTGWWRTLEQGFLPFQQLHSCTSVNFPPSTLTLVRFFFFFFLKRTKNPLKCSKGSLKRRSQVAVLKVYHAHCGILQSFLLFLQQNVNYRLPCCWCHTNLYAVHTFKT